MTKANTYAASDSSSSSSSSSVSIFVTKEPIDPVYAKAHGLDAGTIQIEEDTDSNGNKYGRAEYHFYISKGNVDFGAYSSGFFHF